MKRKIPNIRSIKIKDSSLPKRSDGLETRNRIIEYAGRLFARDGYDKTTSKNICQTARVNQASVNYHFGSRDGLYLAVLEEIQNRITKLDYLIRIRDSSVPPQKKAELFLDYYIKSIFNKESWVMQLWTREVMNPSPLLKEVVFKKIFPKVYVISEIFSEYLGYPENDPRLHAAIMTVLSPFFIACMGQEHPIFAETPVKIPKRKIIKQLRLNAFLSLEALHNSAMSQNETERALPIEE